MRQVTASHVVVRCLVDTRTHPDGFGFGEEIIHAAALGVERHVRIVLACKKSSVELGWHRTATGGGFGAAVGVRVYSIPRKNVERAFDYVQSDAGKQAGCQRRWRNAAIPEGPLRSTASEACWSLRKDFLLLRIPF